MEPLHTRALTAPLSVVDDNDGRVEGLVVPYDRWADIMEVVGGKPVRYRERFVAGAFERAMRAPHRVTLAYNHDNAMSARMGYGVDFAERDGGLWGVFQLDPSRRDHARDILTSTHRGLSVSFRSLVPTMGSERDGADVTRKAVHLAHVAAVTDPAYVDAHVELVRHVAADDEPSRAELDAATEAAELERRRAAALERIAADTARREELAERFGNYRGV